MIKVPDSSELADFNISDFVVPPLEKYTDKRGFMYILKNDAFPGYIKVGRTSNIKRRLDGYNSDSPYKVAKMCYISDMFEDVNETERKILQYLYDETAPTTLSREWFLEELEDKIISIIEKAETIEAYTKESEEVLKRL